MESTTASVHRENRVGDRGRGLRLENLKKSEPAATPQAQKRAPLTAEQQTLAERYIPMARSLAKPLKLCWPTDAEEFESAALMALVEAAQSFDADRNVKFATFARYRIWGALRDVQRGMVPPGWRGDVENAPALRSIAPDSEDNGRVLLAEHDRAIGADMESLEHIEGLFRRLPARHAEACRQIYVNGLSHGDAARYIGCSKSRLSYLHKEALDIISDAYKHLNRPDRAATAKTAPLENP